MMRNTPTRQSGYALIIMVLALMGVGGIVVAGFTQQAKKETEHQRYLHNERVLREAKQALLQYAYNYPVTAGNGPGRMPCPDTDNDGIPNATALCGGANGIVGRFPWAEPEMNFYDARDASGERLWYAVSSGFANSGLVTINSDTQGGITIQDRSGAVLHDGAAGTGVVAVIIAPGTAIERNGVLQDRAAGPNIAANYLDLFGAADNADFVNNNANGFVTGPIYNPVDGSLVVNDQMILVTTAEVIAMAEQATLQAYREAIRDYMDKVACSGETPEGSGTTEALCLANGGTWTPVYPWLYNYEGIDYVLGTETIDVAIDKLSTFFPAEDVFDDPVNPDEKDTYLGIDTAGGNDGIFGRIPSTFSEYFTEASSLNELEFETRLSMSLSLIDPAGSDTYIVNETYCKDGCPGESGGTFVFYHDAVDDGPTLQLQTSQVLSDVRFIDIDPDQPGQKNGRLAATFAANDTLGTFELYFYDNDHSPLGYWTACPDGGDELMDCSRDSSGNPTPGAANNYKSRILHMTVTVDFAAGENNFDFDYSTPPVISHAPANSASHATISATYGADQIISFPATLSATYEYVRHWHEGDTSIDTNNNTYATGNVNMSGFSLASLQLSMRYFPELPRWAFDNGWHNAIRMAYALEYQPPGTGPCTVGTTCLLLDDSAGTPQNVASLLVIAGQHDWQDVGTTGKLRNSLLSVFDNGNENTNPTFYRHRGNDELLVIEEL